MYYVNNKY